MKDKNLVSKISRAIVAVLAAALLAVPVLSGCSPQPSEKLPAHLITTPDADPVRPIDSFETVELSSYTLPLSDEQYRYRIDELYRIIVDERKKPILSADDPVKPVYDAAVEVMNSYILNAWHTDENGNYKIVHTVHDWIAFYVDYDFDLYERFKTGETVDSDPAFDIDGVFLNKRAVCDGISRAMSFLCAIENIDCIQVTGTYIGDPHAWNRVKIDGKWYNVDVTADAANYSIKGEDGFYHEIAHGYFLLSDDTFRRFGPSGSGGRGAHVFYVQPDPSMSAVEDYDYYDGTYMSINGNAHALTVTSREELLKMFEDINKENGRVGKIEIKLAFADKGNVNDGDVYESELRDAYGKLDNPSFSFGANQKPYIRYPNGVYLCLMYK